MAMQLKCPHCGHVEDDVWEVLEPDRLDTMKCESCGAQFHFAIMECHRCADERAFSWAHPPEPQALDLLTCESCCGSYRDHEASQPAPSIRL